MPKGNSAGAPSKTKSRNARKRANRKNRVQNTTTYNVPSQPIYKATDTAVRRLQTIPRGNGLSDQGIAFLKCAFAPPDFSVSSLNGVPDQFLGPRLVKKHRYVSAQTLDSTNDYWFVLAPVPGVSHFQLVKTAGADVAATDYFVAQEYSDKSSIFGSTAGSVADNVNGFRFISNHFELIPTVNQTQWSGSIQAWKIPASTQVDPAIGGISITGLQGTNEASRAKADQFTGPFIGGFYGGSFSSSCEFLFTFIQEGVQKYPAALTSTETTAGQFAGLSSSTNLPGFDSGFEVLVIKVSGMSANQSCIIKSWACVEYKVTPSSSLYDYTTVATRDPVALELYRSVINGLPIGVPYEMNENFWNRVLQVISQVSRVGSFIPGPIGMISSGVNMVTRGIQNL